MIFRMGIVFLGQQEDTLRISLKGETVYYKKLHMMSHGSGKFHLKHLNIKTFSTLILIYP